MLGGIVEARDVTERKHLENELTQSQKMEFIGCLTGGLAHVLDNVVDVIVGSMQSGGRSWRD